ncbi:hypothetical protein ACWF2L_07015 [Streptomyces anulatus]
MQTDDFFCGKPDEDVDWTDYRSGEWVCQLWELDVELMESLRFGPLPDRPDLDVAVALTRLLHEDFVARGTRHDERMSDEEVVLAVKAHRAVLERLGLERPQLPFRHHSGFYDYWRKNDMSGGGGWQARRECIEELLGPTRQALEDLQETEYEQRFKNGPRGNFKNLIFAAVGPKPQIVLRDAVSNEVEIVRNADNCLVYKDPLPAAHSRPTRRSPASWSPRTVRRRCSSSARTSTNRTATRSERTRNLAQRLGTHTELGGRVWWSLPSPVRGPVTRTAGAG